MSKGFDCRSGRDCDGHERSESRPNRCNLFQAIAHSPWTYGPAQKVTQISYTIESVHISFLQRTRFCPLFVFFIYRKSTELLTEVPVHMRIVVHSLGATAENQLNRRSIVVFTDF